MFSDSEKPRMLSLDAISWDSNELSGKFQGCQTPAGFVARWEEKISGQLSESEVFNQSVNSSPIVTEFTDPKRVVTQTESSASISPASVANPLNIKRQSLPTPLVPASKQARLEINSASQSLGCSGNFEEEEMDKNIRTLFIGKE